MDLWRGNVSSVTPEQVLSPPSFSKLGGTLDDLFSSHSTEGDVSLEWLSAFVEDCLSSTGNCIPQTAPKTTNLQKTSINSTSSTIVAPNPKAKPKLKPKPLVEETKHNHNSTSWSQKFVIPSKARSKRKRSPKPTKTQFSFWSTHSHHDQYQNPQQQQQEEEEDCDDHDLHMMMIRSSSSSSDPPLLQQAYWLADSELIFPKKQEHSPPNKIVVLEAGNCKERFTGSSNGQQPRRCSHCLAQRTPQWRAGPLGPKTLCNACGVRYKSGRLLPEYRPAKSPTFLSYKHSNSHKKVLEMRTTTMSTTTATTATTQQH